MLKGGIGPHLLREAHIDTVAKAATCHIGRGGKPTSFPAAPLGTSEVGLPGDAGLPRVCDRRGGNLVLLRMSRRTGEAWRGDSDAHPMSPSAHSWFAILLGMVLGPWLLAAARMFSGDPKAGFVSMQPRGAIAAHWLDSDPNHGLRQTAADEDHRHGVSDSRVRGRGPEPAGAKDH